MDTPIISPRTHNCTHQTQIETLAHVKIGADIGPGSLQDKARTPSELLGQGSISQPEGSVDTIPHTDIKRALYMTAAQAPTEVP